MTREEFVKRALEFLEERAGPLVTGIDGETELVASGILDSLLMLEFFFFVEEVCGGAIDPEIVSTEALSTINNAYQLITASAPRLAA